MMYKYFLIFIISCTNLTLIGSHSSFNSESDRDEELFFDIKHDLKREFRLVRRFDWAQVAVELRRQNHVWDTNRSYTEEHGCGTDQEFVVYGKKYENYSTQNLIVSLNSKKVMVRK